MLRSLQILCLSLAALCLAAVLPLSASSAEAKDRDIKVTSVDDKYLNLEVDGKKVQVPLPEGYVVADREMYAKFYGSLEKSAKKTNSLLLCLMIDMNGNEKRKNDSSYLGYNYCKFVVISKYRKQIFDEIEFKKEISILKEDQLSSMNYVNEMMRREGSSQFTFNDIFENNYSVSFINIEDQAGSKKYKKGFSETYFIADSLVVLFDMSCDIYNENDIARLTEETISYAKKVSRR